MTLKRPKDKGTKFETWVTDACLSRGLNTVREPAGAPWDVTVRGSTGRTIEALVARENYGKAMATVPLADFLHLIAEHGDSAHIECKHLARIALHGIYERKFPCS